MQYVQPAGQPRLVTMKRERPLDQRHPVLVERQQVVQRHRQVVEVGDERPIRVDDDLAALAPDQALHEAEVRSSPMPNCFAARRRRRAS